jgi:hypothetical protein
MLKEVTAHTMVNPHLVKILLVQTFLFHWLYSPLGPWPLLQFHDHFTDGRTPWTSVQLVATPIPKHRTTQTQNKHTHTHTHQTSMPRVGFESTIPASERAKTVHALDRSATVTGFSLKYGGTLFILA